MTNQLVAAPALQVSQWFNSPPIKLEELRGRVVMLHAFQMLCPGCVSHGIPQATAVHEAFKEVVVLGLHTVFEHHEVMGPAALQAFIHEYRIRFPVAVDEASPTEAIPQTMQRYGMQGTPTAILLDAHGRIRHHWFGRVSDLLLGAAIGRLLEESKTDGSGRAFSASSLPQP